MIKIEAYKTLDGKKFIDKKEAERHTVDLLGLELEKLPHMKPLLHGKHNGTLISMMGDYKNAFELYKVFAKFFVNPIDENHISDIIYNAMIDEFSFGNPDVNDLRLGANSASFKIKTTLLTGEK